MVDDVVDSPVSPSAADTAASIEDAYLRKEVRCGP